MDNRVRLTTYLAGAIESASKSEALNWREIVRNELNYKELLIYDPIEQESAKVGKESMEQVNYITGLKKGGHWEHFLKEMWKIWFGQINRNSDFVEVLKILRYRKHIDGNRKEEMASWGDFEAVCRSSFVISLSIGIFPKGVRYESLSRTASPSKPYW